MPLQPSTAHSRAQFQLHNMVQFKFKLTLLRAKLLQHVHFNFPAQVCTGRDREHDPRWLHDDYSNHFECQLRCQIDGSGMTSPLWTM